MPGDADDETELLQRARAGDEAAFETIFERSKRQVLAVMADYPFDADRTGELVQDVRLTAWKSFSTFAGESKITTWIVGIAKNRARTAQRSLDLERRRFVADAPEAVDPSALPDDEAADAELAAAFAAQMKSFKAHDRLAFRLKLAGLDYAEIGAFMEEPVAELKARVDRVRRKLARVESSSLRD